MLLATHKCVVYWPASHAIVTCYSLNGFDHKPPLCKGRWHFRKKMTEGLLLTSLSSFCSLRSISQSLSLAFARQLPLHKGAFDTIKFFPCFLFAFSSSAEPLLNHATIAWFSFYKKRKAPLGAFLFYAISSHLPIMLSASGDALIGSADAAKSLISRLGIS